MYKFTYFHAVRARIRMLFCQSIVSRLSARGPLLLKSSPDTPDSPPNVTAHMVMDRLDLFILFCFIMVRARHQVLAAYHA